RMHMPQFGLLTRDRLETPATADLSTFPPLPWTLPRAEVAQATFEVDLSTALDLLPELLSRPVPPLARIIAARYPDSPIGPYAEALLILSSRFAMLPRNDVVAAVVTSERAREAYGGIWSLHATVGQVELQRRPNPLGGEDIEVNISAAGPLAAL